MCPLRQVRGRYLNMSHRAPKCLATVLQSTASVILESGKFCGKKTNGFADIGMISRNANTHFYFSNYQMHIDPINPSSSVLRMPVACSKTAKYHFTTALLTLKMKFDEI
jgi:hypothetical protein